MYHNVYIGTQYVYSCSCGPAYIRCIEVDQNVCVGGGGGGGSSLKIIGFN